LWSLLACVFVGCKKESDPIGNLGLSQALVGEGAISLEHPEENIDLPLDRRISLTLSIPIDQQSQIEAIHLRPGSEKIPVERAFKALSTTVPLTPISPLLPNTQYTIQLTGNLKSIDGIASAERTIQFTTVRSDLRLVRIVYEEQESDNTLLTDIPLDFAVAIHFSAPLSTASLNKAFSLSGPQAEQVTFSLTDAGKTLRLQSDKPLPYLTRYNLTLSDELTGTEGEKFAGMSRTLYTTNDPTPKFPVISDDELLTLVQRQTFRYFWDFAHPASGMARERNTSGNTVTSGGSGFGIMALIVGMERHFINRAQGMERMDKILAFLEKADRFHGAWAHWMDGNTGSALPFSSNDNGGDLVETSLLL